jgi:beta-lactamase regulating signal transducer with metallopeptidase domain
MAGRFLIAWCALVVIAVISVPFVYSMQNSSPNVNSYMINTSTTNQTAGMIAGFTSKMPAYILPLVFVVGALAVVGGFFFLFKRRR